MDEKKLKALAAELAKSITTEADLNAFSRMLTKLTSVTKKIPLKQVRMPATVTRLIRWQLHRITDRLP